MPKESLEVRAFLHCWVWRWDREDLYHHQRGGLNLQWKVWFWPPHPQPKWFLDSFFFLPDHFWLLPKGFAIKKIGSLKWWSGCWSLRCPSWELRRSHLWSSSPSSWHFTASIKTKGFCINLPRSSLTASETGLKSVCSGACDSSSLQESW